MNITIMNSYKTLRVSFKKYLFIKNNLFSAWIPKSSILFQGSYLLNNINIDVEVFFGELSERTHAEIELRLEV